MPSVADIDTFQRVNCDIDSYVLVSRHPLTFHIGPVLRFSTNEKSADVCKDHKLLYKLNMKYKRFTKKNVNNYCFLLCGGVMEGGIHVVFSECDEEENGENMR